MLTVEVKKTLSEGRGEPFTLDATFSINSGITALLGASGSGKTTTLRLIAGILRPDESMIMVGSQIYFDSKREINLPVQARRVGFVFQDYALFPHLTAEQNIAYGVQSESKKAKLEWAAEMLALFHIAHVRRRFPREMSGGEQQRVALARPLASDPTVVLLDEPLSAVDVDTRGRLLDEIEGAQRKSNVPFLYVTHNHAEAARLGEHRITLKGGRVVQEETSSEKS